MQTRELTDRERQSIRRSVKSLCANFDTEYGCLLLEADCFMSGKAYTGGALCKWYRNAVLPLVPELEHVLSGGITPDTKICPICGKRFQLNGRQTYCSEKCAKKIRQEKVARNVRRHRAKKGCPVIN